MKARKTVAVKQIVEWANQQLARTDAYADYKFKSGVAVMVEKLLYESNSYNGFMFIDSNDIAFGTVGYYSRHYSLPRN